MLISLLLGSGGRRSRRIPVLRMSNTKYVGVFPVVGYRLKGTMPLLEGRKSTLACGYFRTTRPCSSRTQSQYSISSSTLLYTAKLQCVPNEWRCEF